MVLNPSQLSPLSVASALRLGLVEDNVDARIRLSLAWQRTRGWFARSRTLCTPRSGLLLRCHLERRPSEISEDPESPHSLPSQLLCVPFGTNGAHFGCSLLVEVEQRSSTSCLRVF